MPTKITFLFRLSGSYGVTLVLLFLLMVLTVVGTLDQRNIGLYQAQAKYFQSLFFSFHVAEIASMNLKIPFPGAYLVFICLFINLVAAFCTRSRWRLKKIGSLLCHLGILALLAGCFFTYHYSREGYLTLSEGDFAEGYTRQRVYELLLVDETRTDLERVVSFPHAFLRTGAFLERESWPFAVKIRQYHPSCVAVKKAHSSPPGILGEQGIELIPVTGDGERTEHGPGCVLEIFAPEGRLGEVLLPAGSPVRFSYREKKYRLLLRKREERLPYTIRLVKFIKETYPGTDMPKKFESKVVIRDGGIERESTIAMNRPLSYRGLTFYQSSYAPLEKGRFQSTLAVVRNPARIWPYVSCLMILLGMALHFLLRIFMPNRPKPEKDIGLETHF